MSILKGGLIIVTGGRWISSLPDGYALAQLTPLGIPLPIWCMVVLTIIAAYWMHMSPFGRAIYAIGIIERRRASAEYHHPKTILKVFMIQGLFVGIASILFSTQLSIIQSTVPPNLELTIITAAVVGGEVSLEEQAPSSGRPLRRFCWRQSGSSLIFINVSPFWLRAIQGTMILMTVLADLYRRKRHVRHL